MVLAEPAFVAFTLGSFNLSFVVGTLHHSSTFTTPRTITIIAIKTSFAVATYIADSCPFHLDKAIGSRLPLAHPSFTVVGNHRQTAMGKVANTVVTIGDDNSNYCCNGGHRLLDPVSRTLDHGYYSAASHLCYGRHRTLDQ